MWSFLAWMRFIIVTTLSIAEHANFTYAVPIELINNCNNNNND